MAYSEGHARREEIARLLGFTSYRQQRAFAAGGDANKAEIAERRRALQERGQVRGPATPRQRTQRVFKEPDGRFVRTNRNAELRAFFRIAAGHDGRVTSATITVRTDDGPRDVELWSKGGLRADTADVGIRLLGGDALDWIADQIAATGASAYLGFDPEGSDILLAQLAAEW